MSSSTPTAPLNRADGDVHDEGGLARDVIVGVDGSERALGAVRWATREAARRGAPLRILHAAPYLGQPRGEGRAPAELPHARRITARAYTVARQTESAVQASTEVVPEDPVSALLRAVAAGQLLVLGSTATGAADELVLNHVAQRIAARSPQPVVVVPRQRDGDPEGRSVVAVLGAPDPRDDEAVAAFAAATAARWGRPLTILLTRAAAPDSWTARAEEWARRFPGLQSSQTDLPDASPTQVLNTVCPSSLLVLSVGRGGRLHRDLDGPHRWLLRHCTSPMAFVPLVRSQEAAAQDRAEQERRDDTERVG